MTLPLVRKRLLCDRSRPAGNARWHHLDGGRDAAGGGVGEDQFDLLAENTMHDRWTYTNPRKIGGPADVKEILRMAA